MGKRSQNNHMLIDCPMCGKNHEVEIRTTKSKAIIKGEEVFYNEKYCYCEFAPKEESEFYPGKFVNENLISAQNAYRKKNKLLTTYEIIDIRDTYSLSQVDLANLLGWGEATVSRYESKHIQNEANDNMLRMIKEVPEQTLQLLEKYKDKFDKDKHQKIKKLIYEQLDKADDKMRFDKAMLSKYSKYSKPSSLNGNKTLDLVALKSLISYIAKKMNGVHKVKLMKNLWYCDVLSFLRTGHSFTGLVYVHGDLGALPLEHDKFMYLKDITVKIEEGYDEMVMYKFLPNKNAIIDFSLQQKRLIDEVITKFKDWNTKKIVNYMHDEVAYKNTKQGEIIPFKKEFTLNDM